MMLYPQTYVGLDEVQLLEAVAAENTISPKIDDVVATSR
jgi:hypothetical protein